MGRMRNRVARRRRGAGWLAAAAIGLGAFGAAPSAWAIEYEVFVDIDDFDDLLDLYNTEQVGEDTFNTLTELLRNGINLDTASRETLYSLPNLSYAEVDNILAYRDEAGQIGDPANLVVANALSRRKLAAIAPFLLVPQPGDGPIGVNGFVRYEVLYAPGDTVAPPMFLAARVQTLNHLTVGAAADLQRSRVHDVSYDPARDALSAEAPRPRPRMRKYFAQWDTESWGIIAGTYRIGFGQRLVFDSTDRYTPNGFVLDDTVGRSYDLTRVCSESSGEFDELQCDYNQRMAPDYVVRPGQQGVAVGAKRLKLPKGHIQAYAWASYQPRSLYQYKVRDLSRCPDPISPASEDDCSAPSVSHRDTPPLDPQSQYRNETLPDMYADTLGGGNISYFYNRRTHVGITGYGAKPVWLVTDADLDFQAWDRTPYGGPFGAVGADTAWGRRYADVFVEVARSFDSMATQSEEGGGGFAGIVRNTYTFDDHELELSARYYETAYANPFAGPISAPDVYGGLRARDEAGGRIRYNGFLWDRLQMRSTIDVWTTLDPGVLGSITPKGRFRLRGDVQATKSVRPGLWLEYARRDLRGDDRLVCLLSEITNTPADVCRRHRISLTARSRFDLHRRVNLTVQYRHDFQDGLFEGASRNGTIDENAGDLDLVDVDVSMLDDTTVMAPTTTDFLNQPRQDINAFLALAVNPIDPLRMRGRVRWLWDDIQNRAEADDEIEEIPLDGFVPSNEDPDPATGGREHSYWATLDIAYTIRRWAVPRIRYDFKQYVDKRASTADRRNPEHWLRFEFVSRF